jgi:hypothetical protein
MEFLYAAMKLMVQHPPPSKPEITSPLLLSATPAAMVPTPFRY